jgi:D-3-phosphoglycerate dehydrogenase / 2-oxoglutarate reductase
MKIRSVNSISDLGISLLKGAFDITEATDASVHGIVLRSHKLPPEEMGENLLAVARAGAGVNNINVELCSQRGIVVFNTPGANANAVKELVIAGMLMSSRKLTEGAVALQTMSDKSDIAKKAEKIKADYGGPELLGKTLGIVGLGAIGSLVAQAAIGMGMKVVGFDPYLSVTNAWRIPNQAELAGSLEALLAKSDYVTLHVPAIKETNDMVNAALIAKMKPGIRILNFARGEIVNNADMLAAIESGKVAYYVSDFAEEVLMGKKNVLCLPHLGASTPEAEDNCAVMACEEIRDYLQNGNILNSVNLPNANLPRSPSKLPRVAVIHKNIPKMLMQINDLIGGAGLNITEMVNASRGDIAYTMLDTNAAPSADVVGKIKAIDGVLRVRVI